ncbi:MAG TPA: helix-turn-helix domain-containing protein [Candidatus Bilamarchaeum sp.]|nr:helix-turn-helix domain-containing protein [Candidatus Bilamarchaeum sp.]
MNAKNDGEPCKGGYCPVEATLKVLGGKWKILILFHLDDKPKRFSELKRTIPEITEKMLAQQLKELEKDSVISRKVYPQVPPKVEYSMTKYGKTLQPVIGAMCEWGMEHKKRNGN